MEPASNLLPPLSYPIIHLEWAYCIGSGSSSITKIQLLPAVSWRNRMREGEDQGQMNTSVSVTKAANEEETVCTCV